MALFGYEIRRIPAAAQEGKHRRGREHGYDEGGKSLGQRPRSRNGEELQEILPRIAAGRAGPPLPRRFLSPLLSHPVHPFPSALHSFLPRYGRPRAVSTPPDPARERKTTGHQNILPPYNDDSARRNVLRPPPSAARPGCRSGTGTRNRGEHIV